MRWWDIWVLSSFCILIKKGTDIILQKLNILENLNYLEFNLALFDISKKSYFCVATKGFFIWVFIRKREKDVLKVNT